MIARLVSFFAFVQVQIGGIVLIYQNPTNPMIMMEIMAFPQSIHVYPVTLKTLPYQNTSLDALFYVEMEHGAVEREVLFNEAYRILKPNGLFYVSGQEWLEELMRVGFYKLNAPSPLALPTSWRAAYLSIYNGRLHITELEKAHVFPMKSPFFQTAVCVAKSLN